jgi:hypothetical protein
MLPVARIILTGGTNKERMIQSMRVSGDLGRDMVADDLLLAISR